MHVSLRYQNKQIMKVSELSKQQIEGVIYASIENNNNVGDSVENNNVSFLVMELSNSYKVEFEFITHVEIETEHSDTTGVCSTVNDIKTDTTDFTILKSESVYKLMNYVDDVCTYISQFKIESE